MTPIHVGRTVAVMRPQRVGTLNDATIFALQRAIAPAQMAQTARGRAVGGIGPGVATVQHGQWLTSCDPNPPTGPATLSLTNAVGPARTTISKNTVQIGPQIDVHHELTIPAFTLTDELEAFNFPLQRNWLPPTNPVGVDFGAPTFPLEAPAEAQLYARDPEELGLFADTLETDPETIRAQVANWSHPEWAPDVASGPFGPTSANRSTLPDALSLLSPALPFIISQKSHSPDALIGALQPADFFGSRTPSWTANFATDFSGRPFGSSSVKAGRITYPGLCTLEILYARPTPGTSVPAGLNVVKVQSGYPSIFAQIESILHDYVDANKQSFSDVRPCANFTGLSIDSAICFPLVRSDRLLGSDSVTDARGQIFLSIRMSAYTSSGQCITQASILYDIKLDTRGALVIELAGAPVLDVDSPHSPNTFDVTFDLQGRSFGWASGIDRPDFYAETQAVDWRWIGNAGHIQSGTAAFRLVDTGGYLCNAWAPAWAVGGPDPFPAGLNFVVARLLLDVLPKKLNAALRHVQMFPRAGDPAPSERWGCNPAADATDPQANLKGPRSKFLPSVPLDEQEQLGFGFINQVNTDPRENCLGARSDFCNATRVGFYEMHGIAKPSDACLDSLSCCAQFPTDPLELQFLLNAINERDAFGNLAHWGCEELDPGNADCVGATDSRLLHCNLDPNQGPVGCTLIPDPSMPGQFLRCHNLQCRSRAPGFTPPEFDLSNPWIQTRSYGCAPNVGAGACYFLPPARRLIPNVDGIQLVFYDNERDCANASVALRYAVAGFDLPMGDDQGFPDFNNLPSVPDYVAGADISNVGYRDAVFQGRWRQAYRVPSHPMAICNYTRFNDLPPPSGEGIESGTTPVLVDSHGHPWRPCSFPRPYAVYSPSPIGPTVTGWHCTKR